MILQRRWATALRSGYALQPTGLQPVAHLFWRIVLAGEWLKFDKATPDKPEVFAIASQLDLDPDAVVGKLLRVWSWFDTHTADGNAPCVSPALLDRCAGVSGFVSAMQKAGWIVVENGGCLLPNFDRHCGETAKQRGLQAKRSAGFRARNASRVTSALPREEKRREEQEQDQNKERSPTGSRLPQDWNPSPEGIAFAEGIRPDVDWRVEAAKFRDYWLAVAGAKGRKADWPATWRNWIRRADGVKAAVNGKPAGKQIQGLMALEAMKSGNRLAARRTVDGVSEALLLGPGTYTSGRGPAGDGSGVD